MLFGLGGETPNQEVVRLSPGTGYWMENLTVGRKD